MEEMANLVQLLEQDKGGERNPRSGNIIGNLERPGRCDREGEGRGQVGERTDAENEVSRQVIWQVTEQGREGTTPESTRAVTDENDREEGRAESRRAGRRMITSGRTRTVVTRQEQPGESVD
jgi:hypothetical protein